ncbi:MAG: gntR [Herminiimonas sp.]|nr:gntR [Herminiimonas sp.]MDB5852092.1 gntR [Herminiimonas sp.]
MASSTQAKKLTQPAPVSDEKIDEPFGDDTMLGPSAKLTDLAYRKLEEAIVTLKLRPGTSVSESSLSKATGIGRTPVREAIQRLAREHLIHILPQRGLLIPEIDVSKQLRLLETRREIERLVCRSAAKRATASERDRFARLATAMSAAGEANDDVGFIRLDGEFNELCIAAAHNEFSEGAMRLMHGLSRRFWYFHYKQAADLPEIARLHAAVASAIAKGDVRAAAAACDELLDNIEAFTRSTVMTTL